MKKSVCVGMFMILFVSAGVFAQTSGRANFGEYPTDYPLAYATMVGLSESSTVKTLFGSNAYFATSFQGFPAVVTLESSNGAQGRFSAQLLLTAKVPQKGDVRIMRMQIRFESDDMSEMSYVRYIKIANMMNGQESEQISYGDQMSDGNMIGFFLGIMELFWDVSKYK
jgi:hypothetical protein